MNEEMMQGQKPPQPYKTEVIKEDVEYVVQENGDVKVIQKIHSEIYWKSSAFTSLIRQNEEALKMFKDAQSAEYIEKMAKQEKEVKEVLDKLKPVQEISEKNQQEDYTRMRHEGLKANVIKALDDKEVNENWFQMVWFRTKSEIKDPVFKELDAAHQSKLLKILQRLKRKDLK